MSNIDVGIVKKYVEENIRSFHEKRINSVDKLKLNEVLRRKNPYLFKAKNVLTAEQIVRGIVDAHISSNEETLFGNWLEGLAIYINSQVYKGRKSANPGIDLEFEKDGIIYFIAIKSGPNWGNSSQIGKMQQDFARARKVLGTSGGTVSAAFINGCCYGKDNSPNKGEYQKLCGQRFWSLISGDDNLYTDIIEPLGHLANERNEEFLTSYAQMVNKLTREFTTTYCDEKGAIDWKKLVEHNSGITK
jgi:hypothetical protein